MLPQVVALARAIDVVLVARHHAQDRRRVLVKLLGVDHGHVEALVNVEQLVGDASTARTATEDDDTLDAFACAL